MEPAEIVETERRLENWGRWARGEHTHRGASPGTCGSAERMYTPPREDEQRFENSARDPVNTRDAERVEAAVVTLKRAPDRRFLMDWYVYRMHPVVMGHRHKMPLLLVGANAIRLVGAVFYHLERQPTVTLAKARRIEYSRMQYDKAP